MDEDEVTISYEFSAAEHVQAIHDVPQMRWFKRAHIAFAVTFTLYFLGRTISMAISRGWGPGKMLLPLAIFGIPSGLFLLTPSIVRRFDIARYRRQTPDGTPQVRRFGSKGFSRSADQAIMPWGLVTHIRETPDAFLFVDASSVSWTSLPKRAMSQEQLSHLRVILNREFKERPKELRLLPA